MGSSMEVQETLVQLHDPLHSLLYVRPHTDLFMWGKSGATGKFIFTQLSKLRGFKQSLLIIS